MGSWIHSRYFSSEPRVFFTKKSYLPAQTPAGIKTLRQQDLDSLRGNGQGERHVFDRICDYDKYNDLGLPDLSSKLARPVLGGSQRPYPRRCRTGCAPTKSDPLSESRPLVPPNYVPRDETLSGLKTVNFGANVLSSVLNGLVPFLETALVDPDLGFPHLTRIDSLYEQCVPIPPNQGVFKSVMPHLVKAIDDKKNDILLFETPELMDRDRFAWVTDEEFSRQTLDGLNPYNIQLVTDLMHWVAYTKWGKHYYMRKDDLPSLDESIDLDDDTISSASTKSINLKQQHGKKTRRLMKY